MPKVIAFVAGLLSGVTIMALLISYYLDHADPTGSPAQLALGTRLESIPIETICSSIASGRQILGDDQVIVWTDRKRYIVGGWTVTESGIPVFLWTGADLPKDIPECERAVEP